MKSGFFIFATPDEHMEMQKLIKFVMLGKCHKKISQMNKTIECSANPGKT